MRLVRWFVIIVVATVVAVVAYVGAPYARAASLFVRVGNVGGRIEAFADFSARPVTVLPRHMVPVRQGEVEAQFYKPDGRVRRSVLLIPGVH
jgi:hypothetical protein